MKSNTTGNTEQTRGNDAWRLHPAGSNSSPHIARNIANQETELPPMVMVVPCLIR